MESNGARRQFNRLFERDKVSTFNALVAIVAAACLATGCLQNGTASKGSGSVRSSAAGDATSSSTTTESQCNIFKNNSNDYATCLSCKTSLCPCTSFASNGSTCTGTNINSCTVNEALLVACVHDNIASGGGTCSGMKCGDNQVADFTNCSCKDATPPTSIGPAPGFEDQSTPYLEPGFFISNRFCSAADTSTSPSFPTAPLAHACLTQDAAAGSPTNFQGKAPVHVNQAPVNVYPDVGYLRWDLSLDASQYPSILPLTNKLSFTATTSTIIGTVSMYYQLKPNTLLTENRIKFNDCLEHFSGTGPASGTGTNSTTNFCDDRSAVADVGSAWTPPASNIALNAASSYSGTAKLEHVSFNGSSANANVTLVAPPGNPAAKLSSLVGGSATTTYGMGKLDSGMTGQTNNSLGNRFTIDDDCNTTTGDNCGTGLFANTGYYKYSWGPLTVRKNNAVGDYATGSVTGRIAVNMNLGYIPESLVESTALSPEGILGRVATRDCSSTETPSPCVITGVYRAPGGAIMTQSYSPRFSTARQASGIDALPTGINAVSTPRLIEDVSQLAVPTPGQINIPSARLRAFVRADDGNVYMSRLQNGTWNNWLNLGRPWICNVDGTSGSGSQCDNAAIASVYRPFNSKAFSDIPSVYDSVSSAAATKIEANNGISIAGEPTVISYMDESVGAGNGIKGYVMVLARVSHLKSTRGTTAFAVDGTDARIYGGRTYGPYHNAVFYTVAAVSTAAISGTATPYFDSASNWSQWMPIRSSNGSLFRIQGNPSAFIKVVNTNEVRAFVMGTSLSDANNRPMLHPPIAPRASDNRNSNAQLGNSAATFNVPTGWYNYGNTLIWSSLQLNVAGNSFENTSGNYAANLTRSTWASNAGTFLSSAVGGVVISDWTHVPLGSRKLDAATGLRTLATGYLRAVMTSAAGENGVSPYSFTDGTINSASNRSLRFRDFTFTNGGGTNTWLELACAGTYTNLSFYGNVYAVNLDGFANASAQGNGAVVAANGNTPSSEREMFIFGRAVCPNKRCDTVNPTVTYATVDANSCGTTEATEYYPALSRDFDGASLEGIDRKVGQFYSSSDVIPMFSGALDTAGTDVPVYLFFRTPTGNIANGIWGSKQGGLEGTSQYSLGTAGGQTN